MPTCRDADNKIIGLDGVPDGLSNTIFMTEKVATCVRSRIPGAQVGPYYNIWAYGRTAWPEWNPVFGYEVVGPASKFQVQPTTEGATATCDPRFASAPRASGILVGLGDGSVRLVSSSVSPDTWWAACTPDQGEVLGGIIAPCRVVTLPELVVTILRLNRLDDSLIDPGVPAR